MDKSGTKGEDYGIELQPHQRALIDRIVSLPASSQLLLRSSAGLGKAAAVAVSVKLFSEKNLNSKVLILCPKMITSLWSDMLYQQGLANFVVDRFKFREFLDQRETSDLWPSDVPLIMSDDFAKQSDIKEYLIGTSWGLIVADEAHRFSGIRGEVLDSIANVSNKLILLGSPNMSTTYSYKFENYFVVDWDFGKILSDTGAPIGALLRPTLIDRRFSCTKAELELSKIALQVVDFMKRSGQNLVADRLLKSFLSSPASFERSLSRLLSEQKLREEDNSMFSDQEEDSLSIEFEPSFSMRLKKHVRECMSGLDGINCDTKIKKFSEIIELLLLDQSSRKRICVLTDYLSTFHYLSVEFEEMQLPVNLLNGGIAMEARYAALTLFNSGNGALLATTAVISEDISLREVTDLILYDLPPNRAGYDKLVGRFNQLGRVVPLCVHLLLPEDEGEGAYGIPKKTIKNIFL